MSEQLSTKERLARAIIERSRGHYDPRVERMIKFARAGHYDDFETDIATPLIALRNDLLAVGYIDLAQRVMDGDFDSTIAEADAWMEREGRHLFGLFGKKKGQS
jgi:hypothetical protein